MTNLYSDDPEIREILARCREGTAWRGELIAAELETLLARIAKLETQNVDAQRALWLVLRQTGTVVVPLHDIVSADWSKCQIEQTEHPLTGDVQLRATLLPTKHQEPKT